MKKRKILAFILAICIAGTCFTTFVSAASIQPEIKPMYTGLSRLSSSLTISSTGTATCSATGTIKSGYTATITMQLHRGSGAVVRTWTFTGVTGAFMYSKTQGSLTADTYYVSVNAKVYDGNGIMVDNVTVNSVSKIYSGS